MASYRTSRIETMLIAIASIAIGGLFLLAAGSKAFAPLPFEAVVAHVLRGLGAQAVPVGPLVIALIASEAFIGAAYVLRVSSPVLHRFTLAVVGAFVVVLAWMWIRPPPQGCSCIGFWRTPGDPRQEMVLGILRNGGLIACIYSVWTSQVPPDSRYARAHVSGKPGSRNGFTLIELLCAILVVAVLLALTLPFLAGTKRTARRAVELADARQVYVAIGAYSADYRENFPYCATPGELYGPLTLNGGQVRFNYAYFTGQAGLFINLLAPDYLSGIHNLTSVNTRPSSRLPPGVVTSQVWLTYTAFAHPQYWKGPEPPSRDHLLRGALWSQIAFPSSKGLLLDLRVHNRETSGIDPGGPERSWGIIWADGSAVRRPVDLNVRYRTVSRPAAMFDWPVLATEGGVAGRDFVEARRREYRLGGE